MILYQRVAMNPIEAQARSLYARIDEAVDPSARQLARRDFHAYHDQLNKAEKTAVQPLLDEILAHAARLADEMMPIAEQVERRLKNVPAGTET